MFKVAKLDRYDMVNSPNGDKPAFTVWFSGCHFKCDGCQNPELWDGKLGDYMSVGELLYIIQEETSKLDVDDVVLLGGEPLDQDMDDMLFLVKCLFFMDKQKKIWLYTGYEFEDIPDDIKRYLYTIKCGRYIKDMREESRFPITTNQKVFRNYAGDWRQYK